MRGTVRRRHAEEEEESVFVSMTDMTVSFLFIVMLLLAFFASRYTPDTETVPLPEHQQVLAELAEVQARLEQFEAEIERLREETAILTAEHDNALREIERLRRENATLTAERDDALRESERLRELLAKAEQVDPLEAYIGQINAERRRVLKQLQAQLKIDFPDLDVVLSEQSDALRFQGEGLFDRGNASLRANSLPIVERVSMRLHQILPCYTLGDQSRWAQDCNQGMALIEAIQIEGHTDSDGSDFNNLMLSTARANETFRVMTDREPRLTGHLNMRNQPVLSVAGYGEMRPVSDNDTDTGRATNRRIDLRLIMQVPSRSEEIQHIRDALVGGALP
ncbi:MAG: OmpA family protein [Paracoccus sp. (in: a-proteobacteria)]|uniref:OmpA/MotB family protein n=1 Tax=Paracoccus sp. TaxID=267 RepID=UPI003241C6FE